MTDISPEIDHRARVERQARHILHPLCQNQLDSSKVLIMPPTEVAAPVFAPAAPTFTQAAVRFAISFAALIGLSLLLAGL